MTGEEGVRCAPSSPVRERKRERKREGEREREREKAESAGVLQAFLIQSVSPVGKYHCTVDLLFGWFGISCMTTNIFLQNRLIQTSQTGGQRYSDTSPFNIPWSICQSACAIIILMVPIAFLQTLTLGPGYG
jgi:hypothetical protein